MKNVERQIDRLFKRRLCTEIYDYIGDCMEVYCEDIILLKFVFVQNNISIYIYIYNNTLQLQTK